MESGLEYIDELFGREKTQMEITKFEQRIVDDPAFAEEVAFYLGARQVARDLAEEEKIGRFREIYRQEKFSPAPRRIGRPLWYAAAAAVFIAILAGWYLYRQGSDSGRLADGYITEHWQRLGVSMSSKEDSIQTGLVLYNEGKWQEALRQFEDILRGGGAGSDIVKYAGIVALQLKDYDKALGYFKQLADYKLYANPGLFYQAITLMERKGPEDPSHVKQLLMQVVQEGLAGKETAREWLKKL